MMQDANPGKERVVSTSNIDIFHLPISPFLQAWQQYLHAILPFDAFGSKTGSAQHGS
ncbi:hypothetical protein GJ744_005992 [Endocarpon pusillum]|uniref:Uncharacterized protein n=1 Tax=Endocarpon pusillum TaxID=364733 RepID=A0A8H7A8A3_9EURO|nr:hypothetical protein GJ744_005992 [Endocarpon pusillum]